MYEAIVAIFLVMTLLFTWLVYPVLRHYLNYQREKENLEKRYNRLWRSRRDLLVCKPLTLSAVRPTLNNVSTQFDFKLSSFSSSSLLFVTLNRLYLTCVCVCACAYRTIWIGRSHGKSLWERSSNWETRWNAWIVRWSRYMKRFSGWSKASSMSTHSYHSSPSRRSSEKEGEDEK